MRRTKELQWRRALLAGAAAIVMAVMLAVSARGFSIVSHAESAAQVTATSANIRQEPNPNSTTIGSSEKDKVISIKSQVQGTDGYTWYEVYVNADTLGYIRSDLVQITDGTTPPTGTAPAASAPAPASQPATPVPDEPLADVMAVNPASASVTGGGSNGVRIRQNASTTSRIITNVDNGMALTITGTATGKDSKTWYQVAFISNGAEVSGFIRSDYTTVKPEELTPYTEEPPVEEPPADEPVVDVPEPAVTKAYDVVFQNDAWMLVDCEGKHGEKDRGYVIQTLFDGVTQNAAMYDESVKTVKGQKIIIIILVILLVAAAAVITLLIFKVKDMADAQYFSEVENETLKRRGTRPQGSSQKTGQAAGGRPGGAPQGQRPQGSRPAAAAQGQRPQGQRPQGQRPGGVPQGQRPQGSRPAAAPQGARPAGASQGQQPQAAQGQPRPASQGTRPAGTQSQQRPGAQGQRPQGGRPAQGQQNPGWQSRNFMADDDEFEFEFLNYEGDEPK